MGIVINYSLSSSKNILIYFHFMCLSVVPVYMCVTCTTGVHRGQRALELLKLVTDDWAAVWPPERAARALSYWSLFSSHIAFLESCTCARSVSPKDGSYSQGNSLLPDLLWDPSLSAEWPRTEITVGSAVRECVLYCVHTCLGPTETR